MCILTIYTTGHNYYPYNHPENLDAYLGYTKDFYDKGTNRTIPMYTLLTDCKY